MGKLRNAIGCRGIQNDLHDGAPEKYQEGGRFQITVQRPAVFAAIEPQRHHLHQRQSLFFPLPTFAKMMKLGIGMTFQRGLASG